MPFMLGAIYRRTDAEKLLGIGRRVTTRLKREGKLEVRRIGNKDYVKSDDIWNAMVPVSQKPPKPDHNTTSENTTNREVFTEAEAAEYLRINERVLEDERKRGRITPFRIAKNRIRYTKEMLRNYMQNHPLNQNQAKES